MAQIGNVHPDTLVPAWHAARQLTPEETETVGRLLREHLDAHLAERETMDVAAWLEKLPPIPPRRSDRSKWAIALEGQESSDYFKLEAERRHIASLRHAVRRQDYRTALLLMTHRRLLNAQPDLLAAYRPSWEAKLQEIREALDDRIDDAVEQAVAAKAAELRP